MHDEDFDSTSVCEVHKVLLYNVVSAGVEAASVAEDNEKTCFRVELLQVPVPDALNVGVYELGGVVACVYRKIARLSCDVVDAVWDDCPAREDLEVVIKSIRFMRFRLQMHP